MQKDKDIPANPDTGSMLIQKTYEDFNKKRPNPNEIKKPPPLPDIPPRSVSPNQNDDGYRNQVDNNQSETKSEGSEKLSPKSNFYNEKIEFSNGVHHVFDVVFFQFLRSHRGHF